MASAFLALHRQDSIACQRAFERIAQGNPTIPNEELGRLFKYLGAVTAPETLDLILKQFSPENYVHEVTKDDAMNLYAIWLRMVSVSEPPALELLDKRKVAVQQQQQQQHQEQVDQQSNSGGGGGNDSTFIGRNNNNSASNIGSNRFAQSSKRQNNHQHHHSVFSSTNNNNSAGATNSLPQQHWVDRLGAYLGNTNVVVLTISRTLIVMLFTLVHWFSVFFRDADKTLRCGPTGIGLDCGHTVLIALDLLIEYYAGDYRQQIQRALDEKSQKETKKAMMHAREKQQQQQQEEKEEASAPLTNENSNTNTNTASGPFSIADPLSPTSQKKRNSIDNDHDNNNIIHQQTNEETACCTPSSCSSAFDELKMTITIFFSYPKNILGLISLLPFDLLLCAGDAVIAATVLNHIRLISVVRNYINPNPPTPVPLTTLFADIYYFWMPLWMMTYTFVVFSSVFAIIFIIFRNSNTDSRAQQLDFLTAMYLVVQTFTTVGFGDVFVYGTAETWFAVVLVLIGMIANATVIGSLVALIQLGNATLVRSDKIRETHAVLHYFSIPRLLQLEILGFQEHVLFSDVVSAFHADIESFPTAMKDAMILQHRFDVLRQIEPFSQASSDELFFFAKELVTACFKPEEYLSCCSEPHHGIRILLFGLVDRLDARGRYIKTLRSGDCFGLDGILSGKDEEFNHKALAYCDLLVVSYDDFHNILEAMPKLREWMVPALREIEDRILKQEQEHGGENDDKNDDDEGEHVKQQNDNHKNGGENDNNHDDGDESDYEDEEGEEGEEDKENTNEEDNQLTDEAGIVAIEIKEGKKNKSNKKKKRNNNNKQKKASSFGGATATSSSQNHHQHQQQHQNQDLAGTTANLATTAKVLRSPVSMIDTTGGNLSMVHDLRSELRVFRRGLQTLAVAPALNSMK